MTKGRLPRGRQQRGIALIAVLLLLVFILTIVGGLFYRHQIHVQKVTKSVVGEQALLLLLSAESWAKSVLEEDARESGIDHRGEIWGRNLPVLPIEGGQIGGCLMDLQGLFNINSLAWYSNKSWDDELQAQFTDGKTTHRRLLANLLSLLELDSADSRIAALVDWLDTDAWLISPDSAEDNEYLLNDPPYRAANHSLTELTELSLVQGFSSEDVVKLAPWVNIISEEAKININTAPPLILMALSPYITESAAQALDQARPFETVDEFYTMLANVVGETRQTLIAALPAEFVSVSSNYFALKANVELAGLKMSYSSIIRRQSNKAEVLSRTLRNVPPAVDSEGREVPRHVGCNPGVEVTETK